MADFLDFDSLELNVDEQVNGAKEHPLKGMKTGAKMAYVGGLLFACHADDNTLQKEERSLVMGVAHSLGVGKEEVDELAEMIVGLSDKIGYLKEIVATLKDRKTILFFLCDMIKAMGADGELNDNAQKLIGAIVKLAHLSAEDEGIIANYQLILSSKGMVSAEGVDLGNTSKAGVMKSLFDWFIVSSGQKKCDKKVRTSRKSKRDGSEGVETGAEQQLADVSQNTSECADEGTLKSSRDAIVDKLAADDFDKTMRETKASLLTSKVQMAFTDLMFDGLPNIWYGVMIPEKKKYNAHIAMMVKEDEHVVQIDTTMFGSNKEGLVITDRALYYKNSFEIPRRVEWKDLKMCVRDGLYIDFGDSGRFACTIGSDDATERFCKMLSGLIADLQSNLDMLNF